MLNKFENESFSFRFIIYGEPGRQFKSNLVKKWNRFLSSISHCTISFKPQTNRTVEGKHSTIKVETKISFSKSSHCLSGNAIWQRDWNSWALLVDRTVLRYRSITLADPSTFTWELGRIMGELWSLYPSTITKTWYIQNGTPALTSLQSNQSNRYSSNQMNRTDQKTHTKLQYRNYVNHRLEEADVTNRTFCFIAIDCDTWHIVGNSL